MMAAIKKCRGKFGEENMNKCHQNINTQKISIKISRHTPENKTDAAFMAKVVITFTLINPTKIQFKLDIK